MTLQEIGPGWKPPDGLGYSGLRPVRLSGAGYALVMISGVFLLGSVLLGFVLWNQSQRERIQRERLEREGAITEASVIRVWRDGSKERTPRVRYSFQADGVELTGDSTVPSSTWKTLRAGDTLPVRYMPGSPGVNHPAAWRTSVTPPWIAAFVPAMFWGIAGLLIFLIQRQWRLLSEGRPAPGIVLKRLRSNRQQSVVTYEFRLLNGAIHRGRSKTSRRSDPIEGAPVCVLYDPENPRRSGIYPFQLVRLEGSRSGAR